jgi:lactoylglutathione lyase
MRLDYAIVFVSDMSQSVSFYRDVVGLDVKFQTPVWTELSTGEATLALHSTSVAAPSREPSREESAGRCRPGLCVGDLTVFHARMLEHGVPVEREPREVFGVRIANYVDPDGLIFSVSERHG